MSTNTLVFYHKLIKLVDAPLPARLTMSKAAIGKCLGVGEQTVRKELELLERNGYILINKSAGVGAAHSITMLQMSVVLDGKCDTVSGPNGQAHGEHVENIEVLRENNVVIGPWAKNSEAHGDGVESLEELQEKTYAAAQRNQLLPSLSSLSPPLETPSISPTCLSSSGSFLRKDQRALAGALTRDEFTEPGRIASDDIPAKELAVSTEENMDELPSPKDVKKKLKQADPKAAAFFKLPEMGTVSPHQITVAGRRLEIPALARQKILDRRKLPEWKAAFKALVTGYSDGIMMVYHARRQDTVKTTTTYVQAKATDTNRLALNILESGMEPVAYLEIAELLWSRIKNRTMQYPPVTFVSSAGTHDKVVNYDPLANMQEITGIDFRDIVEVPPVKMTREMKIQMNRTHRHMLPRFKNREFGPDLDELWGETPEEMAITKALEDGVEGTE